MHSQLEKPCGSDTDGTHTAASHLLISSRVHVSGSPLGSSAGGNISPPQIDQTPTAVIKPVKAIRLLLVSILRPINGYDV